MEKVSCLRKQHIGRDWALHDQPSDLKSNALTTTPPWPQNKYEKDTLISEVEGHYYQYMNFNLHLVNAQHKWKVIN